MIKVLFTIPNFDTAGSGKAMFNIASGLDKKRFESHILCRHQRGDFFKTVRESGIPVHVFEYTAPMRPLAKGLRECWSISRAFRKVKPDIIHSFHYAADYSEPVAARMAGCTWVYTKKNMNWGGSSKNAWKLRSLLAKRIVVQNTEMVNRFFANSESKTTLIPRGVETTRFRPQNGHRRESVSGRTIVCVANLVPVKGVEVLIEAFRSVRRDPKYSEWRLKIVGDDENEYGSQLKHTFRMLVEEGDLIFTGKRPKVESELEDGEIFVLPTLSRGEGSPVSLLEAMSMGLVVVGSSVSGITDQLIPLGEDHLFEPGNVQQLAERLKRFMDMSQESRRKLGEKIRSYCSSSWDISVEVARHERLYTELSERA